MGTSGEPLSYATKPTLKVSIVCIQIQASQPVVPPLPLVDWGIIILGWENVYYVQQRAQ